jgi:hypothetical protein
MLILRPSQVQVFDTQRRDEYLGRLVTHLRSHFRDQLAPQSDDQLRAYGRHSIARAALYGLTHEQAVSCFAHLPLLLGEDFEANPRYLPLINVLGQRSLNQDTRAKFVVAAAYNLREARRKP